MGKTGKDLLRRQKSKDKWGCKGGGNDEGPGTGEFQAADIEMGRGWERKLWVRPI